MARPERPYVQFNFVVDLNDSTMKGDVGSYVGGFQEVSNIGMEVTVTEYRNGNDRDNGVRKITGLNKASDVTLKRGVIGTLHAYRWLDDIRTGNQNAMRLVTITLLSEDHKPIVDWELHNARIIKIVNGPLNAKGNDVAMEEIVLAYEKLIMNLRNE
jgi:phage tail-like protein